MWCDPAGVGLYEQRRVRAASRADIERWQRSGLVVDEDFERGISPLGRQWRNVAFTLVVAAVGVAGWLALSSARADNARRVHGHLPRRGTPSHSLPGGRGRLSV